jgi:hypothetical protein
VSDEASPLETIEVVTETEPTRRWDPKVGSETMDLLEHFRLPAESTARIRDEAVSVLASCAPPTGVEGSETGLAVGYVQSGKTMSFTTVAALARDNGYAIVVVIAGTSIPLLRQSTDRLHKDLRLGTRPDRKWLHIESSAVQTPAVRQSLKDAIEDWSDPFVPQSQKRTILITTMKHHGHLKKVTKSLSALNLRGLPALVIDDEGDQASLNAAVLKQRESTTYSRIKALREALPHHSYLQYTATPQAPLLINIIDTLSPRFAEVLTPGPEYVGGKQFFRDHPELVEIIPGDELASAGPGEPPESLKEAMRLFYIGVAAGFIRDEGNGNRSMMIHPSQRTAGHSEYFAWAVEISKTWQALLDPTSSYPEDRLELLEEFRSAHAKLEKTVADLPAFDEVDGCLHYAIRQTVIEEVNAASGPTPEVRWRQHYPWILVGGQAMDRGFTVEGLTVTYMPRGIGVGNADTVQQRARFFGYKRRFLGYCRVFLEQEARLAYEHYIEHEEDVRRRLIAHRATGAPLSEWRRAFFLDELLKPTRQSVLDLAYSRASADGEGDWYVTKVPHDDMDAVQANRVVVEAFLSQLPMAEDVGAPERTVYQRHHVAANVSIRAAMEGLLTSFHITHPTDSSELLLLQVLLSERLEEEPGMTCTVYQMSAGKTRERSLNKRGQILNLFQGAAPSKPAGGHKVGDIYPGDREVAKRHEGVVIQVHNLDVKLAGGQLRQNVPTIAVHVPAALARDLLVQDQPAQGSR